MPLVLRDCLLLQRGGAFPLACLLCFSASATSFVKFSRNAFENSLAFAVPSLIRGSAAFLAARGAELVVLYLLYHVH